MSRQRQNKDPKEKSDQNQNSTGENKMRSVPFQFPKKLVLWLVVLLGLIVLVFLARSFWYFEVIENDQVGIAIEAGQIREIKQPGIAYDFGLFVELVKVTTSAVAITVDDPELITRG